MQVKYREVAVKLQDMGLDKGWGDTVGRIKDTIRLLLDIMQAADAETLQDFLGRLPIVSRVAIISPHGFFAQSNALGKPDTGGQVYSHDCYCLQIDIIMKTCFWS